MSTQKNNCGDAIKKLRSSLNLTQEQFGALVNLNQKTISGYEKGNRKPCSKARAAIYKFAKLKGKKIKLEHLCEL